MSEIKLKSKLISVCDYRKIDVSRYAIPLVPDPERTKRDTENFLRRFAVREEADQVKEQDMVTLSCSSANARFNREHLTLRVGMNLFSGEFEEKLVGMSAGGEKTLTVGKDTVCVTIEKIVREMIPELTDEMAANCGVRGIKTVQDIYDHCRRKQFDDLLEEPADDAYPYMARELCDRCGFELDREEIKAADAVVAPLLEKLREFSVNAEEEGKDGEIPEDLTDLGASMLKNAVLGFEMLKKEGTLITTEEYEAYIRAKVQTLHITEDEAKEKESLLFYAINEYSDKFTDAVEEYTAQRLKEAGEDLARFDQN